MFKRAILSAFILAAGLVSVQANAAFVSTDWKVAGDKYATLDTETGLEWLDLTRTAGQSIDDVAARLTTTYKGWRFPTFTEIIDLMTVMFPMHSAYAVTTPPTGPGTASKNAAWTFSDLFLTGVTTSPRSAEGLFTRDNGVVSMTGVHYQNSSQYWTPNNNYVYSSSTKNTKFGVYLVSDGGATLSSINNPLLNINNPNAPVNQVPEAPADVPVHTGFGLLGLLLAAFGLRRRKSA